MQLDSEEIVDSCLMIMDQMAIANNALEEDNNEVFVKSRIQRYEELKTLSRKIDKNVVLFSTELLKLKEKILQEVAVIEAECSASDIQQEYIDDLMDNVNNESVLFIQHILMNALGDDSFYKLAKEKKLLKNTEEEK